MLNIHEVKAHNVKVVLKALDKLITRLEESPDPIAKRKPAVRSTLPKINPNARPPRKIYKGATNVSVRAGNVRSAMPTEVTRIAHVNGVIFSPSRVPQSVICMDKVKAYLAK